MTVHAAAYERVTGCALVAGSLNVHIDQPWVMAGATLRLDRSEVGVDVGLVPCRLQGVACWLLRTDKNNSGEGDHGLDVLELISAVHLRTALGLDDGDEVVVDIDQCGGLACEE
jgi:CTP-dependent riboflavin kinase